MIILPENFVVHRSVPIHGITQLGLRSHPTGSSTLEASTMTFSFIRPDKPVYTIMSIRPFSPCHPTQAMAGSIVSYVRNPYLTFPGRVHDFHGHSTLRWGANMRDSQIAGVWTHSEGRLHISVMEFKAVILALQH